MNNAISPSQHAERFEFDVLRCPNCASRIDGSLTCSGCSIRFEDEGGVLNLLPSNLDGVKRGEDTVFAANSAELLKSKGRPWRRIINRHEISRFDMEIVDNLPRGRFLELGGETCFASALYKSVYPDSIVYGSDVSPNSLRNVAVPTCKLFPAQPDFLIAVDAECLPFNDATFDAVFCLTMIHHLPHPTKMMNEIVRVLRPGGRFIGIDHSVPQHFRWLFRETAQERAAAHDIQERVLSYDDWVSIVGPSRIPLTSIKIYKSHKYLYTPLTILGAQFVGTLPDSVARRFFPVGIVIDYVKPVLAS
jgi:ubiquinone/menaquinone biosynthesis C-methylase UbiE